MDDLSNRISLEIDEQTREQQGGDWIDYLKEKLVQFHSKIVSYGTNVGTTTGIQKLSSQFEILVFGPARVGVNQR